MDGKERRLSGCTVWRRAMDGKERRLAETGIKYRSDSSGEYLLGMGWSDKIIPVQVI